MDHYFESNGVLSAPVTPTATDGAYPTDGDLVSGIPASTPGAWWFHMLSEEVRNVIIGAGLTPDFKSTNQLYSAIQSMGLTSDQVRVLIEQYSNQSVTLSGANDAFTGALIPAITSNAKLGEPVVVKFPSAVIGGATINLGGGVTSLVDAPGHEFSAINTIPAGNSIVQYDPEISKFRVLGIGGIDQVARNAAAASQSSANNAQASANSAQAKAYAAYPATNPDGFINTVGKLGLGITGETWHGVSRGFNTVYYNCNSYPVMVSATSSCSDGSQIYSYVNGLQVTFWQWQFNGCGSFGGAILIVPPGASYQLNSGQGVQNWVELY
jgi:hypothetical protein